MGSVSCNTTVCHAHSVFDQCVVLFHIFHITSKAAKKAINKAGATLFAIPPRSPDLNPIENLFHIVKKQLTNQAIVEGIYQETWSEFQARVRKTTLEIPATYINNLLLSMPKRVRAVVKCKGLRTKY